MIWTLGIDLGTSAVKAVLVDAMQSVVGRAEVPLAEMETFDQDLTSLTGGRGSFHMELIRYDEVPGHLLEKVAAEIRAHRPGAPAKEED